MEENMAITKDASQTKRTEQNIFNNSYDEDFDVVAVEILGYDSTGNALRRIKVNVNGELKVAI